MRTANIRSFTVGVVLASSLGALAAVPLPNIFKAGDLITAQSVNQNFSSLKVALEVTDTLAQAKQNRVSGACASGSAVRQILESGAVNCEAVAVGVGTLQTDATLTGNGSDGSRLGVKLPLSLTGSSAAPTGLLSVNNPVGLGVVARSQSGDAVSGVSQGGAGVVGVSETGTGVKAWSTNGFALEAKGDVAQDRDSYGFAKAMVMVRINQTSGAYEIARCFNSQQTGTLVSANGCGLSIKPIPDGSGIEVNFGFNVTDRFVNLTSGNANALYAVVGDTAATSTVVTAVAGAFSPGGGVPRFNFFMVVY